MARSQKDYYFQTLPWTFREVVVSVKVAVQVDELVRWQHRGQALASSDSKSLVDAVMVSKVVQTWQLWRLVSHSVSPLMLMLMPTPRLGRRF